MKKVLSLAVTLLLFIAMLFGCSSTTPSPSTTISSSTTIPTTPIPTTVPPTTLPPAPVYVYEKATENFLLPTASILLSIAGMWIWRKLRMILIL